MEHVPLLDCAGRPRSPATLASFHQNRSPHNKGLHYQRILRPWRRSFAVIRVAGDSAAAVR